MQNATEQILVWLPSPIGDAVLCTPALRAIRRQFESSKIIFLANPVIRQVLSPSDFNNTWLEYDNTNPLAVSKKLKTHKFTHAILLKNSFASALACFLARIPSRIGYARDGRGPLLTEKLHPPKSSPATFKPISMIDYYLAIASWLGADSGNRTLELLLDPEDRHSTQAKLPTLSARNGPLVILVPGTAGGHSKCWIPERFAKTADWLITNHNATVVISVAPNLTETKIAAQITEASSHKLINLADTDLTLGELKAMFSTADLVITNDTGPRHIAIALKRKVLTLLGPNDPAWTDIGYPHETKIVGKAFCAPCNKPVCKQKQHLCMQSITVEMLCRAAEKLLAEPRAANTEHKPPAPASRP